MRLDKFLKVSRIIKRRSVAKDASDAGRISVNGKDAKPSTVLKVGDILEINYFKKKMKVKVLSLKEYTKKDDADGMYEILEVIDYNQQDS